MKESQGLLDAMQLDREFIRENHYYLTIEMAKLLNGFVVLFAETDRKNTARMSVVYSCVRIANELFLDNRGFFNNFSCRDYIVDFNKAVPLVLTMNGARKVLEDNGYKVTDVENKRICREWVRNNTPIITLITAGGINIKEYGLFELSHSSLVNQEVIMECDEYTNCLVSPVRFDNHSGGYIDKEMSYLPLRVILNHYQESRGWVSNEGWYTKFHNARLKAGVI